MTKITDLEPKSFWHFFEEISRIPRGSGNEKAIADYIESFGKKRGFYTYRDEVHNVFIRKPASAGCEEAAPLLLQGHMDMVCEKNGDCEHDFLNDPISLIIEDGWVHADGTTLGADNGTAIASMLSILDDDHLAHPVLECLFTVQEEIGLIGASFFDAEQITSMRMLNMDCGGEGTITSSCAGGMVVELSKNLDLVPFNGTAIKILVTGLAGGHSGGKIKNYLGNANRIMGRILMHLDEPAIVSIRGGNKDNAIPRECEAVLSVENPEKAFSIIGDMEKTIRAELGDEDRDFKVIVEEEMPYILMADTDDSRKIWQILNVGLDGVLWMSHSIEDLVEASVNLAVIDMNEDEVRLTFSPRAAIESLNDYTQERLEIMSEILGFEMKVLYRYPGWAFAKDSPLRDLLIRVYKEETGKDMEIKAVHGGLETGIILGKKPGLDIAAIGPDSEGAHSPQERLNISSMERTYRLVCRVREECSKS